MIWIMTIDEQFLRLQIAIIENDKIIVFNFLVSRCGVNGVQQVGSEEGSEYVGTQTVFN